MSILGDLSLWFWRLLPANPILVRVVTSGGRRTRHLWARCIYLGVLFLVLLVFGVGQLGQPGSLAELAKRSSNAFMAVSIAQLALMSFIAPIFTAAAITQEKDANTFHILLTTPLSAAQIVLGSLFSRLYFVWVLLLSGLPIFCITMIYGGVTAAEVFLSIGLAACTALVLGALAIMISITRIGTRRTILSFFVGVAVYMIGLWAVGTTAWGQLPEAPAGELFPGAATPARMSWLAPLHPFMALFVVTHLTPPPDPADVYHYGRPWRWMLAHPHYAYMVVTTLASAVLVCFSLFLVRRGAKEGERTWWTRLRAGLLAAPDGADRRRRPRNVWDNPIAWREAATRAAAGGRSSLRWVLVGCGLLAGVGLLVAGSCGWWGLTPASTRAALAALIAIELAVLLLVVTSTAATSLTREKESQTMELLLATPLTSRYILGGILRGLVTFVLPLVAVPAATMFLFLLQDFFASRWIEAAGWLVALVGAPLMMVAYAALAAIIGLHFSLNSRKTAPAVMMSTSAVVLGAALLSGCVFAVPGRDPQLAALFSPIGPLAAVRAAVTPEALILRGTPAPRDLLNVRLTFLLASLLFAGVYLAITFLLHRKMVRSFDMIVRRQSA